MAAHADPSIRWGVLTRIKAITGRLALDQELAAGAEPSTRPELARRAQLLSGWRARHALADGLERVVADAVAPPVRSIAEASLLLIDGTGPVFNPHPPGTLSEAAFRAAFHAEAG